MSCTKCGKEATKLIVIELEGHIETLCPSCYNYYIVNKEKDYPIPDKGVVAHTDSGKVICHICGRAYTKLGNHLYQAHRLTVDEYRKMFDLKNKRLTEAVYSEKMKNKVTNLDKFIERGKLTRFDNPLGNTATIPMRVAIRRCFNCEYNDNLFCKQYNQSIIEVKVCDTKGNNTKNER